MEGGRKVVGREGQREIYVERLTEIAKDTVE